MLLNLIYLTSIIRVSCINWQQSTSSTILKKDILYVFDSFREDTKSSGITKYLLKDGKINDLKKEYFNLENSEGNVNNGQFFQIPEDYIKKFPDGDKVWLASSNNGAYKSNSGVEYPIAGLKFIDDSSKQLKSSPKIKELQSANMTQSAFSVTGVTKTDSKAESFAIFIVGGITKHPKFNNLVITNTIHKYYLKNNEWKDYSYQSLNEPTIAYHKAINIEDDYLLILGGVSTASNESKGTMIEVSNAISYNSFENLRRYNITKGNWDILKTSSLSNSPIDLKLGRFGFSATYDNGKVYVYGGIITETIIGIDGKQEIKESASPYLGILDVDKLTWEWHHPTNSKGEKVSKGLAFHDSILKNNQLILTHGGISEDKYKYQIHAINLDTMEFSDYIGPTPPLNNDKTQEEDAISSDTQNSPSFPTYAVAIIVVSIILIILVITYLIIKKRRQSNLARRESIKSLQEIWATPKNAIIHTKISDLTQIPMTGNTFTNFSSSNSAVEYSDSNNNNNSNFGALSSGRTNNNNSRLNHYYYNNLPYFQHEVDTMDQRLDSMNINNRS